MTRPQITVHGGGETRSIHVRHREHCAVCDQPQTSLGDHHIFGRTIPIKIRCCVQCHADFHREVDQRHPGPAVSRMMRRLAEVFAVEEPVVADPGQGRWPAPITTSTE